MKPTLFFGSCIALALGSTTAANAQVKITPEMVKTTQELNKNRLVVGTTVAPKGKNTAKTTAAGEPLLSRAALRFDGINFVPEDSSHFSYSSGRTCYQVDYDDSLFYDRKDMYAFDKGANKYFLINTRTAGYLSGNYISSKLDSLLDVGTGDYAPTTRFQNTYDAAFNITSSLHQVWDVVSNTWINTDRYTATFDAAKNKLTDKTEHWNTSSGIWQNSTNITNTYNAAGSLLTNTTQYWDVATSSWINYTRNTYTYDAAERNLTSEYENYDFTLLALVKQTKRTTAYTPSGRYASTLYQSWKPASSSYVNTSRTLYTYDASDNYKEIISQNWVPASSTWLNDGRSFDFTHNATGKITFYNYYRWISAAWQLVGRYKFTYDAADRELTSLIEENDPVYGWYNISDETSTYNAAGDRLSFVNTDFDYTIGDYTTERNRSTYNGSHQLTRTVNDHSDGGAFYYKKDDYLKRYHYTETPTEIDEDNLANVEVALYPVPANEQCTIYLKWVSAQDFSIAVYDALGRVWLQETHNAQSNYTGIIETKQLPSGNYFVSIQNNDGSRIVKTISVMH